jgi:hypothetical protein
MNKALAGALGLGLGIGLMASNVDWEKVKKDTAAIATVAGSLATLVTGAALSLNAETVPISAKTKDEPQEEATK